MPRRLFWPGTLLLLAAVALILLVLHAGRDRSLRNAVMQADPETVLNMPALAPATLARGQVVFAAHCVTCHGLAGKGVAAKGAPDLTDEDHLYGSGLVAEIEQIVLHGIRSGDARGWHLASMPAYGRAKPYAMEPIPPLRPQEIQDMAAYLRSFQGDWADKAAVERGKALYVGKAGCFDCHAQDGSGDSAVGAPNLVDGVWLYGDGSAATIADSIANGHAGSSPAFAKSLSAFDARAVSLYVASLGDASTRKTL
ncbi:c-type cytochrome [Sphingobium sp.]|uniref:c-type cytochrome n=1 Tax=Sphingobium sp. TaxID=1912891 RepID=UPI0028BF3BB9|nr:c-type cytochrome [Sphingobium sp.]